MGEQYEGGTQPQPPAWDETRRALGGGRMVTWLFVFGVAALLILVVLHQREEAELARLAANARPHWLLLALLLQAGTYLADGETWRWGLGGEARRLGWRLFLRLSVAKLFFDQVVPTGGFSGTVFVWGILPLHGISRRAAIATSLVHFIAAYLAYACVLAAVLLLAQIHGALIAPVLAGMLFFSGCAIAMPLIVRHISNTGIDDVPESWLKKPALRAMLEAIVEVKATHLVAAGVLAPCVLFQALIFLTDSATLWAILQALDYAAAPMACLVAYTLGMLARSVGLVPAGMGTFDAAVVGMLHSSGVPLTTGITAVMLFRGFTYFLPLPPGLFFARGLAADR